VSAVRILVTRHGETEWNREQRIQGHLDSLLTPRGEEQARRLGEALSSVPIVRVYVSSSGRTQATLALLLACRTPPQPLVVVTDALREISLGAWEGRRFAEVEHEWPAPYRRYRQEPEIFEGAPGGERLQDVEARAVAVLKQAAENAAAGDTLLVVSHALTIKVMVGWALGRSLAEVWMPPRVEATSVSELLYEDGRFIVVRFADHTHLEGLDQ
jgi:broad specificity phosphatase PhoE